MGILTPLKSVVELSGSKAAILDTNVSVRGSTAPTGEEYTLSAVDLESYTSISIYVQQNAGATHDVALRIIGRFGDQGNLAQEEYLDVSGALPASNNAVFFASPNAAGTANAGASFAECPALAFLPADTPMRILLIGDGSAPTTGTARLVVTGYR